ncbi:hypothetical protein X765_13430 [Mesorhizobium sp. LSHC440B00]|nr:hypothetical protein X765_13430 [Mesorhizobium sp. LSHC440B00]ESX35516.1 hypothetical protein X763_17445 [Mesorhizobium sp. LSHC432A00]
MRGLVGMLFSKRRDSKHRSGPSTNWLKAKCYAIDEFDLLGVEREAGKPAFALIAERGTGKCARGYGNASRSTQARRPRAS